MYNVRMAFGTDRKKERPCDKCGAVNWAEGTEEQYVAETAKLRKRPDHLLVCQGCGQWRVTLTTVFGAP
jgi:hypothetical protein